MVTVNLVTFIMLFALEGFENTIIPLYGSLLLGLSPDLLGIILALGVIVRFAASLAGGVLSDRYGRLRVLVPCLVIGGLGILAVLLSFNWWLFLAAVMFFSMGRTGNNVPLALLVDLTPPDKVAWMTALNRFVADCGLAIGPLVLGHMADRWGFNAAGAFAMTACIAATVFLVITFNKIKFQRSVT